MTDFRQPGTPHRVYLGTDTAQDVARQLSMIAKTDCDLLGLKSPEIACTLTLEDEGTENASMVLTFDFAHTLLSPTPAQGETKA